jgi:hypothetical protein
VQNPSTAMRVLFQVLVVGDLLVIIYLTFFVGLARLPFHDLPLYYWLVLFLLPVLQLISELVWGSPHFGRGNSSRMKNAITRFSIGGLFLLLGGLFVLSQPHWDGYKALMVTLGCQLLVLAYSIYRRSQDLK